MKGPTKPSEMMEAASSAMQADVAATRLNLGSGHGGRRFCRPLRHGFCNELKRHPELIWGAHEQLIVRHRIKLNAPGYADAVWAVLLAKHWCKCTSVGEEVACGRARGLFDPSLDAFDLHQHPAHVTGRGREPEDQIGYDTADGVERVILLDPPV